MKQHQDLIVRFLKASSNDNLPESRLWQRYSRHFPRSTFDDALRELIDAGMVERVPPLHVKLK
jgi:hypothetical protein